MSRQLRVVPLALVIILTGCVRPPSPPVVPVEDDKTIVFPHFFDRPAGVVGVEGELYDVDGVMLRAVMIAVNDFLPYSAKASCPDRPEAQSYRVTRQGNIIFVYIYENEAYCGASYLALDSGAKYAISIDGRILRRVLDGQPEGNASLEAVDAGPRRVPSRPGVTPAYDSIWNKPSHSVPQGEEDGGVSLWADGGSPLSTDGGGAP